MRKAFATVFSPTLGELEGVKKAFGHLFNEVIRLGLTLLSTATEV